MSLLRQACYRAAPMADPRTHLVPIEAIHQLTGNPNALPSALEGRPCLLQISVVHQNRLAAQLAPQIIVPAAADLIRCTRDGFPDYPEKFPPGAYLLVNVTLLDGH